VLTEKAALELSEWKKISVEHCLGFWTDENFNRSSVAISFERFLRDFITVETK
jgi:hypothetical protein